MIVAPQIGLLFFRGKSGAATGFVFCGSQEVIVWIFLQRSQLCHCQLWHRWVLLLNRWHAAPSWLRVKCSPSHTLWPLILEKRVENFPFCLSKKHSKHWSKRFGIAKKCYISFWLIVTPPLEDFQKSPILSISNYVNLLISEIDTPTPE